MRHLLVALKLFVLMTVVLGLAYPLFILAIAQMTMKEQANGSLLSQDGLIVGSRLLAQKFTEDRYFWPRPSSTDHSALPSGSSNLGPTSAKLKSEIAERRSRLAQFNPESKDGVPFELLFASASGLDPHISPKGARFQIDRIAKSRKLDDSKRKQLIEMVETAIDNSNFSLVGMPCINVLQLNLSLDRLEKGSH